MYTYVHAHRSLCTCIMHIHTCTYICCTAATPPGISPPSLTLRIPKDQIRTQWSGKTGSSGLKTSSKPGQAGVKTGQATIKSDVSSSSSSRLPLSIKVTRSKAWLEGYLLSGDPLKMFLAAVYDYRDASGMSIAEVFHELPSVKV